MKSFALKLIKFYQRYISLILPPCCRFLPSCSEYTAEAISHYGFFKGSRMGLFRICRCHPFHEGGFDPVPKNK